MNGETGPVAWHDPYNGETDRLAADVSAWMATLRNDDPPAARDDPVRSTGAVKDPASSPTPRRLEAGTSLWLSPPG